MPGDVLRDSVQPDLGQGRPCPWTAARFTKFTVDPWEVLLSITEVLQAGPWQLTNNLS